MHYPISYSFGKETIRVEYNKQIICFHAFYSREKGVFREFSRTIEETRPQDLNDVMAMARELNIRSQAGHTKLDSSIIF